VPLHPTQLYEAIVDLALAGLVVLSVRAVARRQGPPQQPILLHLGGYSLLRFGFEFLHGDRGAIIGAGMTAFQVGLLTVGALCAILYLLSGHFSPGRWSLLKSEYQMKG
jgi:prolipoprotein diacylglyceryltransferase